MENKSSKKKRKRNVEPECFQQAVDSGWAELRTITADETYSERYVRPFDFSACKVLLVKSAMNTGKTQRMKELIESTFEANKDARVLMIGTRVAFCQTLKGMFPSFTLYSDCKSLEGVQKCVCQFESIFRLGSCADFDLVVLDEVESTLDNVVSVDTNRHRIVQNSSLFAAIVRNAKAVLAMDADLSNKSIQTFRLMMSNLTPSSCQRCGGSLCCTSCQDIVSNHQVRVVWNQYHEMDRNLQIYEDEADWQFQLKTRLTNKERIAVIVTSKKKLEELVQHVIEPLKLKYKAYHTGKDSSPLLDFADINAAWSSVDVVLYTSRVTVGADFSVKNWFDRIFVYAAANTVGPRIVDQMMGRIRYPRETDVHVFHNRPLKTQTAFCSALSIDGVKKQLIKTNEILDKNASLLLANAWHVHHNELTKKLEWTLAPYWLSDLFCFCQLELNLQRFDFERCMRLQAAAKEYTCSFVASTGKTKEKKVNVVSEETTVMRKSAPEPNGFQHWFKDDDLKRFSSPEIYVYIASHRTRLMTAVLILEQRCNSMSTISKLLDEADSQYRQLSEQTAAQGVSIQRLCCMLGLKDALDTDTVVSSDYLLERMDDIESLFKKELVPLLHIRMHNKSKSKGDIKNDKWKLEKTKTKVKMIKGWITQAFNKYVGASFLVAKDVARQGKKRSLSSKITFRCIGSTAVTLLDLASSMVKKASHR